MTFHLGPDSAETWVTSLRGDEMPEFVIFLCGQALNRSISSELVKPLLVSRIHDR